MFAEGMKKLVEQAIEEETKKAVEKWGPTYNSLHEGYAVLKEEMDEARDEFNKVRNFMYDAWGCVKLNNGNDFIANVNQIRNNARNLALEAVQIAAVCDKILRGKK